MSEIENAEVGTGEEKVVGTENAGGSTSESDEGNVDAAGTTPPPEYVPNYKFKVHDSEYEFDKDFQPFINNIDLEKKMREVYEKAYGLDVVKPKYEKVKNDYQTLNKNWETVSTDLQKLGMFLHNKDYGNFFKTFNLTDQDVMAYALDRLQFYDLPPEKRDQIQKQQKNNEDLIRLTQENARLKDFQQQQELGQLQQQLENVLYSADVNPILSQFDARAGKAGAFREAVIHHANIVFSSTGKDMSPQEAVHSYIQFMGAYGQQPQQVSTNPAAPKPRAATLPQMQGSNASHVKTKIKSLEDLKKIRDNFND